MSSTPMFGNQQGSNGIGNLGSLAGGGVSVGHSMEQIAGFSQMAQDLYRSQMQSYNDAIQSGASASNIQRPVMEKAIGSSEEYNRKMNDYLSKLPQQNNLSDALKSIQSQATSAGVKNVPTIPDIPKSALYDTNQANQILSDYTKKVNAAGTVEYFNVDSSLAQIQTNFIKAGGKASDLPIPKSYGNSISSESTANSIVNDFLSKANGILGKQVQSVQTTEYYDVDATMQKMIGDAIQYGYKPGSVALPNPYNHTVTDKSTADKIISDFTAKLQAALPPFYSPQTKVNEVYQNLVNEGYANVPKPPTVADTQDSAAAQRSVDSYIAQLNNTSNLLSPAQNLENLIVNGASQSQISSLAKTAGWTTGVDPEKNGSYNFVLKLDPVLAQRYFNARSASFNQTLTEYQWRLQNGENVYTQPGTYTPLKDQDTSRDSSLSTQTALKLALAGVSTKVSNNQSALDNSYVAREVQANEYLTNSQILNKVTTQLNTVNKVAVKAGTITENEMNDVQSLQQLENHIGINKIATTNKAVDKIIQDNSHLTTSQIIAKINGPSVDNTLKVSPGTAATPLQYQQKLANTPLSEGGNFRPFGQEVDAANFLNDSVTWLGTSTVQDITDSIDKLMDNPTGKFIENSISAIQEGFSMKPGSMEDVNLKQYSDLNNYINTEFAKNANKLIGELTPGKTGFEGSQADQNLKELKTTIANPSLAASSIVDTISEGVVYHSNNLTTMVDNILSKIPAKVLPDADQAKLDKITSAAVNAFTMKPDSQEAMNLKQYTDLNNYLNNEFSKNANKIISELTPGQTGFKGSQADINIQQVKSTIANPKGAVESLTNELGKDSIYHLNNIKQMLTPNPAPGSDMARNIREIQGFIDNPRESANSIYQTVTDGMSYHISNIDKELDKVSAKVGQIPTKILPDSDQAKLDKITDFVSDATTIKKGSLAARNRDEFNNLYDYTSTEINKNVDKLTSELTPGQTGFEGSQASTNLKQYTGLNNYINNEFAKNANKLIRELTPDKTGFAGSEADQNLKQIQSTIANPRESAQWLNDTITGDVAYHANNITSYVDNIISNYLVNGIEDQFTPKEGSDFDNNLKQLDSTIKMIDDLFTIKPGTEGARVRDEVYNSDIIPSLKYEYNKYVTPAVTSTKLSAAQIDSIAYKQSKGIELTNSEQAYVDSMNKGSNAWFTFPGFGDTIDRDSKYISDTVSNILQNLVPVTPDWVPGSSILNSARAGIVIDAPESIGALPGAIAHAVDYIESEVATNPHNALQNIVGMGALTADVMARGMIEQVETDPIRFLASCVATEGFFKVFGAAGKFTIGKGFKGFGDVTGVIKGKELVFPHIAYREMGSTLEEYDKPTITGTHATVYKEGTGDKMFMQAPGNYASYAEPTTPGREPIRFTTVGNEHANPTSEFFLGKRVPSYAGNVIKVVDKAIDNAYKGIDKKIESNADLNPIDKTIKATTDVKQLVKDETGISKFESQAADLSKIKSSKVSMPYGDVLKIEDSGARRVVALNVYNKLTNTADSIIKDITTKHPSIFNKSVLETETDTLPGGIKSRVAKSLSETGRFTEEIDKIYDDAKAQSVETGKRVAVPTPKQAEGWLEAENESAMVAKGKAREITSKKFIGTTDKGVRIYKETTGAEVDTTKGILDRLSENRKYNMDLGLSEKYTIYNMNHLKFYAHEADARLGELYGDELSRPGAYEGGSHGPTHTGNVSETMIENTKVKIPESYFKGEATPAVYKEWLGRIHDVTKVGAKENPKIPHALSASEAVRRGLIKDKNFNSFYNSLTKEGQQAFTKAISEHTTIKPVNRYLITELDLIHKSPKYTYAIDEAGNVIIKKGTNDVYHLGSDLKHPVKSIVGRVETLMEGIKTSVVDRPSKISKSLANADRADLSRFGIKPLKRMMFTDVLEESPEETISKAEKAGRAQIEKELIKGETLEDVTNASDRAAKAIEDAYMREGYYDVEEGGNYYKTTIVTNSLYDNGGKTNEIINPDEYKNYNDNADRIIGNYPPNNNPYKPTPGSYKPTPNYNKPYPGDSNYYPPKVPSYTPDIGDYAPTPYPNDPYPYKPIPASYVADYTAQINAYLKAVPSYVPYPSKGKTPIPYPSQKQDNAFIHTKTDIVKASRLIVNQLGGLIF